MESLHGDDDEAFLMVIEPAKSSVAKPVIRAHKGYLGVGIVGLDWIIDNQDVAATTGQSAADRCREPISSLCRLKFSFSGLFWI
jgi:hypothetical protein